ncbi:5-formyltetrahydrofolate cyclo-ligase [Nocardioides sp. DS6]|uniref:5-formyltetrahydrofolate cyclo-ligase n=1 Tax=Nocardioides eburneus TaxID=3231482 RepID=A0ABV3SYN0_9ACTN
MADPQTPGVPPPTSAAKTAVRDQLVTARNRRTLAEIGETARALADVLAAAPELRRAATVAAYVSIGSEPGTGPLLDRLRATGKRVLLPCLLPDNDLDWAAYDGRLVSARRGLLEPAGERLGVDAVATADVVLVPGLAVDHAGHRLGRGGGSYDRALARVPVGTFTCLLLYPEEVGVPVPVEPHDRRVSAAATAQGIVTLR